MRIKESHFFHGRRFARTPDTSDRKCASASSACPAGRHRRGRLLCEGWCTVNDTIFRSFLIVRKKRQYIERRLSLSPYLSPPLSLCLSSARSWRHDDDCGRRRTRSARAGIKGMKRRAENIRRPDKDLTSCDVCLDEIRRISPAGQRRRSRPVARIRRVLRYLGQTDFAAGRNL